MKLRALAPLLVLAAASGGCGSTYTGSYIGTETGTQGTNTISYTFDLNISDSGGGSFTGSWTTPGNLNGTASGTYDGSGNLTAISIVQPSTQFCSGTYSGTGSIRGKTLSANVSGSSTCGTTTVTLSLTKQ